MHWLQGTVPDDRIGRLVLYLDELLGVKSEVSDKGGLRYDRCRVWEPFGVRVWFDSSPERSLRLHRGRCTVAFPGSALDHLGSSSHLPLLHDLVTQFWFLASRIDLAFDDERRIITPHELVGVAERKEFTGYRRWDPISPRKFNGEREGDMIVFGRRGNNGSGRMLRVYDKFLESGGERNCIRWEVEFASERARDVAFRLSLCCDVSAFGSLLAAFIGGSIDFLKRSGSGSDCHLNRRERLPWWEHIRGLLGCASLSDRRAVQRVEKAAAWIDHSVASTLAMLKLAFGEGDFAAWLCQTVEQARVTPRQLAAIEVFQREQGSRSGVLLGSRIAEV